MPDELRATIVDPADLVLYDEARRCLRADAFRAAYVMSWIAAAAGILGKLRTMAGLHAALGAFVRDFETKQATGTAKDAKLVDEAFRVGFIDATERTALDGMRSLRNQYGHPTAASPSREAAEHALHVAVTAVLAKLPLVMHGAAKDLAQRIATDRHLVPHDEAAVEGFIETRAAVVHRDARRLFIRELLSGAQAQLGDPNGELLADRSIRMATLSLRSWREPLTPPRWDVDRLQQDFPAATTDALTDTDVWPLVESEDRDRLLSRCLDFDTATAFTRAPGRLLARADALAAGGLLTDAQKERVRSALDATEPLRLLGSGVRYEHVARAIVKRLDNGSFRVAGEGVDLLRSTDDDALAGLDDDLQFELGRSLAYAANQNTFAAVNEVESITGHLQRWPEAFRRGVVIGALAGRWMPLRHEETSKAGMRIALTDGGGGLAQVALDALTPEKTEAMPSPSLMAELRAILEAEVPTRAVEKLTEFLDRVDAGRSAPPTGLVSLD